MCCVSDKIDFTFSYLLAFLRTSSPSSFQRELNASSSCLVFSSLFLGIFPSCKLDFPNLLTCFACSTSVNMSPVKVYIMTEKQTKQNVDCTCHILWISTRHCLRASTELIQKTFQTEHFYFLLGICQLLCWFLHVEFVKIKDAKCSHKETCSSFLSIIKPWIAQILTFTLDSCGINRN